MTKLEDIVANLRYLGWGVEILPSKLVIKPTDWGLILEVDTQLLSRTTLTSGEVLAHVTGGEIGSRVSCSDIRLHNLVNPVFNEDW